MILLIGGAPGWIGRSAWLSISEGREEGAPPPVDLAAERRNGEFVLSAIRSGRLDSVHDISDGGLAVALAEMAIAGDLGAAIAPEAMVGTGHGFLFGEDQARYVAAARPEIAAALMAEGAAAGVPVARLGIVGGAALVLPQAEPIAVSELRAAHEDMVSALYGALRLADRPKDESGCAEGARGIQLCPAGCGRRHPRDRSGQMRRVPGRRRDHTLLGAGGPK